MARFLNTSGTTFFLEELIKNTHGRLVLVSPFLRINPRMRQLLEDADGMEIEIDVVYGKSELRPDEEAWLATLQNAQISYCENLHAKCYLNETTAIVTSMNLYDFSQVNNNEMGILVDRHADTDCFVEVEKEALRLVRFAKVVKPRAERAPPAMLEAAEAAPTSEKPEAVYQKLTTSALAKVCGVKTTQLLDYFTAKGYLEFREGKHLLTERGKSKEAEARFGKGGVYFLWPKSLLRQFQEVPT